MTSPWWRGAVLYHIYICGFFDSDGHGHGDLAGALAKSECATRAHPAQIRRDANSAP